jgi:hypothetical protein
MSCIECRYELDACCKGDICCCCLKKIYNTAKRNKLNNHVQSEKCEKKYEEPECIIVRESNSKSCTISSDIINKLSLPIINKNYSKYLVEWYVEISTTNDAPGKAKINVTLDNLPETMCKKSLVLADIDLSVTKDAWVPYSGFSRIVIDLSGIINLGYAALVSETEQNTKSICVRNVKLTAIKIN